MKVKILSSGKVVDGKYFKDMTDEEIEESIIARSTWDDMDIFVYYNDIEDDENVELNEEYIGMVYMYEGEIEIIEEENYVV